MTNYQNILEASRRVRPFIQDTPILQSRFLNEKLEQSIFFKCECLQTTGSFKLRGATNLVLNNTKRNPSIKHIVASSSGNHAQAVSYIANHLGLTATIYASNNISPVKAAATRSYGAELKLFESRTEADEAVKIAAEDEGVLWVPPFNHPDIIAGQGTVALDAITTLNNDVDAVFMPCGGGGLASGSLISARQLAPNAKVIAAEPLAANDAARSLRSGKIESLTSAPQTLADGAATPAVGEKTFPFLKQLDDFVEVSENQIAYWTQWLQHLLKLHIEPTCAMTMQAVLKWAKSAPKNSKALVIISGGNISQATQLSIWEKDYLVRIPSLDLEI